MASAGGRPPTGGGWWAYHSFSTQLTIPDPPCWRAHSANRTLTELPRAWSVRAPPRDTANHTSSADEGDEDSRPQRVASEIAGATSTGQLARQAAADPYRGRRSSVPGRPRRIRSTSHRSACGHPNMTVGHHGANLRTLPEGHVTDRPNSSEIRWPASPLPSAPSATPVDRPLGAGHREVALLAEAAVIARRMLERTTSRRSGATGRWPAATTPPSGLHPRERRRSSTTRRWP